MKLIKNLVLLALMCPAISFAGLNLPEPTALLKQASVSRTALLDSILAIEFNIPEMRDPATFDRYFSLMDNLKVLAKSSGLEAYYPDVVEKLALNMVSNGMRWLDVTRETREKLSYYIKWMDADTLSRFLSLVEYQMSVVKDPVLLKKMAQNVDAVLPLIDQKAEKLPYVQLGFRRLMSDSAVAILKTENFSNEEFDFWVTKIKISSSFSEYLDFLNQGIYSLEPQTRAYGHIYLYRLSLLLVQSSKMSEVAPNWLLNNISDALSEVTLRMVRMEEPFAFGEFSLAIGQLKSRHLQSLAQQWMAAEKLPNTGYVSHYIDLSNLLYDRLQEVGLRKEAGELKKWLTKSAAPLMAKEQDIEGHWELKNKAGEAWNLTIVIAKENTLIAGLSTAKGEVSKSFFNVSYNLKTKSYVASEREPDSDHDENPAVEFSMKDGVVTLYDPYVRTPNKYYTGTRTQKFPDIWKSAKINAPPVGGTYEGTVYLPNGREMKSRLIITTFSGYTLGRLDTDSFNVELNVGSEGDNGIVVLTSGRSVGGSWFQLRGVVAPQGLNVCVIVGGQGQGPVCSLMKKTN